MQINVLNFSARKSSEPVCGSSILTFSVGKSSDQLCRGVVMTMSLTNCSDSCDYIPFVQCHSLVTGRVNYPMCSCCPCRAVGFPTVHPYPLVCGIVTLVACGSRRPTCERSYSYCFVFCLPHSQLCRLYLWSAWRHTTCSLGGTDRDCGDIASKLATHRIGCGYFI